MGGAFVPLCRAIMNAVVEPHTIATLNSAVGFTEMATVLVTVPGLSALLKVGLKAGGLLVGLPYLAAGCMAAVASLITFVYRLPGPRQQVTPA